LIIAPEQFDGWGHKGGAVSSCITNITFAHPKKLLSYSSQA